MNLIEQINADLKEAMKSGDKFKRDTLRSITSAFKQVEIDTRREITEDDALKIVKKEATRREEAIRDLEKAERDPAEEQAELDLISAYLTAYLPEQLSREAIAELARAAIQESGATSAKDMGAVMKVLMPQVKGRADGKLINEVVRELLS